MSRPAEHLWPHSNPGTRTSQIPSFWIFEWAGRERGVGRMVCGGSRVLRVKRELQEAGVDTDGLDTKQKLLHACWKLKEARRAQAAEQRRLEQLVENLEQKRDMLLTEVRANFLTRIPRRTNGQESHEHLIDGMSQRAWRHQTAPIEAGAANRSPASDRVLDVAPLAARWDKGQALQRLGRVLSASHPASHPASVFVSAAQAGARIRGADVQEEATKGRAAPPRALIQSILQAEPIQRIVRGWWGAGRSGCG